MGINTFVKKRNTVDHMVELLKDGVNVGEVLLNIEFIPEESSEKQWQTVNIKKKPSEIHKLLLSKMKATLEYEENHINVFSNNVYFNAINILKLSHFLIYRIHACEFV